MIFVLFVAILAVVVAVEICVHLRNLRIVPLSWPFTAQTLTGRRLRIGLFFDVPDQRSDLLSHFAGREFQLDPLGCG